MYRTGLDFGDEILIVSLPLVAALATQVLTPGPMEVAGEGDRKARVADEASVAHTTGVIFGCSALKMVGRPISG
jgi:hypothetical protein